MNKLLISYIVAVAIFALGIFGFKSLGAKEEEKATEIKKAIPEVAVRKITNEVMPIRIKANGSLVAKNKVEIFSEVQGVFESSAHPFKPGVAFSKGDVLLNLNSEEFRANLQVQKSNLYQKLISILPDLKLDYPEQFDKWQSYIHDFDINQSVKALPSFYNQQEKLFISGRGIPTAYYGVNNLQTRLQKYTIYAPFYGVITKANVTKGTLVNPGQRLASFISPSVFELEVLLSTTFTELVSVGRSIVLHSLDHKKQWNGKVTRINPIVDAQSQSLKVYVQVSGKGLQEGMYLEADLDARNDEMSFEINRSLLLQDNKIYVIQNDSILKSKSINIIHFNEKTALVGGIEDGTVVLNQELSGAFDGKIVKIIKK